MIAAMDNELLVSGFDAADLRGGDHWVADVRRQALADYKRLGLPSLRDEDWRYTSVKQLAKVGFRPTPLGDPTELAGDAALPVLADVEGARLVFVDGVFAPSLSRVDSLPAGVRVLPLERSLDAVSGVREALGTIVPGERTFVALNTAFLRDGALIQVAEGTKVEHPIYLLFISSSAEEPRAAYPRNLIILEEGAEATVIEDYTTSGAGSGLHFTNVVTEVALARGAALDHYKVQRESEEAFHISSLAARQAGSSNFSSHCICTGGGLVRNNVDVTLEGDDAECTLNGLTAIGGKQHVDNQTRIVHSSPNARSWEMYKQVLDGQASAVFNGKIFVAQDAQKTDAKQSNQSLLLSRDAVINTKPELEIYADDVRCTHGATIGELDEDALFYLRTRGIDQTTATSLLTYAFASEVISGVRVEPMRMALQRLLFSKLPQEYSPEVLG